jgi:hypothetical protein
VIFKATVKKWAGPSPNPTSKKKLSSTNTAEWILNPTHMFNIQDDSTLTVTTVSCYYVNNLHGIRSHGNYMEIDETLATVTTAFDATYENNYIALPVFENDDTTSTAVTRYIPVESISRACVDNTASTTRSRLWYCEGSKEVEVLVDYNLNQIVDVADTNTTTTTTTSS